jgi:hypothetical protein
LVPTFHHGTYRAHVPSIESWSSATEFLIWLDEEGVVWTMGCSIYGIGLGDQECAAIPERVPLPDRAVAIHADHLVGYAVLASGVTFAWGFRHDSVFGQPEPSLRTFGNVPSSLRALHVAAGFRSLALWNDSEIEFRFGRHLDRREVPTVIRQPLHSPSTVCVGSAHVCTLDSVGCVRCAGEAEDGQLGRRGADDGSQGSRAIGTKRGVVREVPMHRVGVVKPVETCALGDAERGASTPKSRGCDVGGTHSVTSS